MPPQDVQSFRRTLLKVRDDIQAILTDKNRKKGPVKGSDAMRIAAAVFRRCGEAANGDAIPFASKTAEIMEICAALEVEIEAGRVVDPEMRKPKSKPTSGVFTIPADKANNEEIRKVLEAAGINPDDVDVHVIGISAVDLDSASPVERDEWGAAKGCDCSRCEGMRRGRNPFEPSKN